MLNEKILMRFKNTIRRAYSQTNVVGASISSLRSIVADTGSNTKYVAAFGMEYLIKSVSAIGTVPTGLTFKVYSKSTNVLLGSRSGGGSFVAGTALTVAEGCYLEITGDGTHAIGASISISTDIDVGGYTFILSNETVPNTLKYNFYMSKTGSTYYDLAMTVGGARHTPTGTAMKPYFTITAGLASLGGGYVVCTVEDSSIYDEQGISLGATLQASIGQTPSITSGVGARSTRFMQHDGNNADTIYVSKNGNDSTGNGNFQKPYLTFEKARVTLASPLVYVNFMDSGNYSNDAIGGIFTAVSGVVGIEPCYGFLPTIPPTTFDTIAFFSGLNVAGYSGTGSLWLYTNNVSTALNIYDCTLFSNCLLLIKNNFTLNFQRNVINSIGQDGLYIYNNVNSKTLTGTISNNIFIGCVNALNIIINNSSSSTAFAVNSTIANNTFVRNINGIVITCSGASYTFGGSIINNTSRDNTTFDFHLINGTGGFTGTVKNNIFGIIKADVTATITYSVYVTNTGFTLGTGMTSTPPQFVDTTVNNYSIIPLNPTLNSISSAYKTGDDGKNMGNGKALVVISGANAVLNGFKIIGKSGSYYYPIGILAAATTVSVKNCDISYFQGTGMDINGSAPTIWTVSNNRISYCGTGLICRYGSNIISYNDFFKNTIIAGAFHVGGQSLDHNNAWGNGYGFFFDNSCTSAVFTNSITDSNGTYGINSSVITIVPSYCDINDFYGSLILPDATCFQLVPLFNNLTAGAENFILKSTYNGDQQSSVLIGRDSVGGDVGAHQGTLVTTDNYWWTKQFDGNPRTIEMGTVKVGLISFEGGDGTIDNYAKAERRTFAMSWPSDQYNLDRKDVEYMQSLIKTRENGLNDDETKVRMSLLPSQFLASGTGVIDSVAKSISDNSQNAWKRNEFKGYWVGIKVFSGVPAVVSKSGKTITLTGPTLTVNSMAGKIVPINSRWFHVISNTSNVLTVSDEQGWLVDGSITADIVDFFKIVSNTENVIYLTDLTGLLASDVALSATQNTMAYYVDFIECRILNTDFKSSQARFYFQQETWWNNYNLILQEI